MNILEEIQNCPVECKELGEVVHSIKTGLNPRKFFQLNPTDATNYYITVREIRGHKIVPSEKTDLINNEGLILCQNRSNLESGDVLFTGTGTIGNVAIIEETPTNWNIKEGVYSIKPKKEIICSKFLMYIFESERVRKDIEGRKAGGTVKSISMTEMKKIKIPIPPLEIQEKIVQILDKMTEYVTELTSELTSRKKQYSFYRDKLLSFEDEVYPVEWKELGEVVKYTRGKGLSKKDKETGNFPIILYGELYTVYGDYIKRIVSFSSEDVKDKSVRIRAGDIVLPISSTTKEAQIGKGSVLCVDEVFLGGDAISLSPLDFVLSSYLMYVINGGNFEKEKMNCVRGTTIQHLNPDRLLKIKIPIPPLEIQEKIVQILDNFDTVCNDLSIGLPKEIELRQKQYEYWREQLLNFNK